MITAVFDMSNIFFRSMYTVGGYGEQSYNYETQFEIDQLIRKIATDVAYTIRQLEPTKVIFALDSSSWRKKIEIEENEGYKANRAEKSTHVNWDNVYAAMAEYASIMESKGFVVSKINNAEADDLMALWMDKILFQKHEHIICISGDEDIRQLVKTHIDNDGKKTFAVVYNPFTYKKGLPKKLYVSSYFNDWLKEDDGINDIFNTSTDIDKDIFLKILNKDVETIYTDGEDIGLRKIFCGDDGDDVPAIYTWMTTTTKGEPVQKRITESKYKKIKETYNLSDHYDIMDHVDSIYDDISKIAKHKPSIDMSNRIQRQIKLVILSKYIFPQEIVEEFEKTADVFLEHDQPKVLGATLLTLLEGTRYISEDSKNQAIESDFFKQMDEISKKLF